jgi:hypothetical protein
LFFPLSFSWILGKLLALFCTLAPDSLASCNRALH